MSANNIQELKVLNPQCMSLVLHPKSRNSKFKYCSKNKRTCQNSFLMLRLAWCIII